MQFGCRYGFGSLLVQIRCEMALMLQALTFHVNHLQADDSFEI